MIAYVRPSGGQARHLRQNVRGSARSRLYYVVRITFETNCPCCGSRDIRKSRRTGPWIALLRQLLLDLYRCRSCFRRFFRPRIALGAYPRLAEPSSAVR